ncbi:structural maintenance of chromosomes protein 5 isoform X1 [Pieris napi]|uniref:structural maintenance of chromosomes protein 5 isoform X1 n=2 Tax=Pieris napi TaxID=78633 RepID=UPI001FBB1A5E|nr:structural maintenance of chromosomes protein 5 isoform X1 [Pieris napi]
MMSKIINSNGNKAGSIYRIALENFVTYKQVELYPGSSLNVIIGPNGTGKSTFVCAIILGLCGKPSVIGRAKKLSEYVRGGCEEATIEIELYQQPGKQNVIITRNFNLKDTSMWYINHKTARENQVQDLITSLSIQVDNLCQLLPQDRVQDFSKMNPQQLLRSTLSAVGGNESVEQLDELIETRNEQRNLSTTQENNAQLLQEQIRLNERIKVIIDTLNQRKDIERHIELCEKKKLWIEYQELKTKVNEYSQDKKGAVKLVDTHTKKMAPLEKVLGNAKSKISTLEQKKLSAGREIHSLTDKVKETLSSVNSLEYVLKEIDSAFQEKLERHRNRKRELGVAKVKLDKLIDDKRLAAEHVGDETSIKMKLAEIHKSIATTNATIDTLKKKKLEVEFDYENNIVPQMRLYQNRINNLQDVNKTRLESLRESDRTRDAYKAVMWLRANRHLFKHGVYEPMMLEINFTDPKFARYLEATVDSRDLIAFTFESSQEMNLFMRNMREMNLKMVNAVCSEPATLNLQRQDISELSYLGFYTYMLDTISAPDAIVRYLCRNYSIHKIPIGDEHTFNNSGNVPANITFYFTENHRFSVRVSEYSGAKSSSITEINPPRLLAKTVDVEQINKFKKQLANFEKTATTHKSKLQEFNNQLSPLEVTLNNFNMDRKNINESIEKIRTLSAQIRLQTKKMEEIQNESSLNIESEKENCQKRQKESVLKQCHLHSQLKDLLKELQKKMQEKELVGIKLDVSRSAIIQHESELRELKNELRNVQVTLENIQNCLTCAVSKAKEKLSAAKRSCNNKLPTDSDFPYKDDFEKLPSDLTALQEHCFDLQTRIDCMDTSDEQVLKEYKTRERTIAKLQSDITNSSDKNKQLEEKMNKLKSKWLPSLETLLRNIDRAFGSMFAKMGCAGEVKLDKTGADEDYDKYGVGIYIRFRADEQLQQLTRHAQSGGERALCTALYLMALQALTTVPFRCVDEINQGMDAINERKMFQLLVKVTTECENGQYFLLTPKLLPQLEYGENIMVHTIMNGKELMNYKKWKHDKHLQKARTYRLSQATSSM